MIEKDKLYSLIDDWSDEFVATDDSRYDLGYLAGISHCMEQLHAVIEKKEGLVIEHSVYGNEHDAS